jgi:hypothetical protein
MPALSLLALLLQGLVAHGAAGSTTVHIDTSSAAAVGPEFDGLGGCSAGTGPRLLVDYPEPARSTLLDFLFLPNHGASLDIIKLEIGGEGDSTTGTESSHEPQPGVFDFHSGYEWFMMAEAVKRNPNITVYGLPWSFPSWLYHGTNHSTCHTDWVGCVNGSAAAAYIAEWVDGAKRVHGVHVSYIGWHNESPWRPEWVVLLRAELDKRGLTETKIVVGDCGPGGGFQSPGLAPKLLRNSSVDISKVADVVGLHYPVSIMPVAREPSTTANPYYEELWALPQKLWASEEYSTYSDSHGGRCLAKLVNRNYVDGNMTALIVWDMVWAWMDGLACSGQGLIWAGEPWSGGVGLVDTVWSIAHTTQVTSPGWRLLKKAGPWGSGGAGYLPAGGTPAPPSHAQCPPQTWAPNASGLQCGGLSSRGSRDADSCAVGCCNDPHCAIWQWAPEGKSAGGSGCWVGRLPIDALPGGASSCTKDKAWVGGSRVPPEPLPPATHCTTAGQFPANASSVRCAGLHQDASAANTGACATACCNDQSCAVWQFSHTAGGGCWRGFCEQPPVDAKGWVGGSRVAPSPPPAPPTPAPPIGGTYVGFVSGREPSADFSLVIETMNNDDSKCAYGNAGWGVVPPEPNAVQFCVSASVCKAHRQLFRTDSAMGRVGPSAPRFVRMTPINLPHVDDSSSGSGGDDAEGKVHGCCFELTLEQNSIVSLSTKDTAKKGEVPAGTRVTHAPEGAAHGCGTFPTPITTVGFPQNYRTNFSQAFVRFSDFPEFLSDIQGVFRIRADPFDHADERVPSDETAEPPQVLSQLTTEVRAMSYGNGHGQLPMSLLGNKNWSDFSVRTVARVNTSAGTANDTLAVYGRCGHGFAFSAAGGYALQITPATGNWTLSTGNNHEMLLATGICPPTSPGCNGWIELEVTMVGHVIGASVGGKQVANVTDETFSKGMAGLGSGWHPAWFKSFVVSSTAQSTVPVKKSDDSVTDDSVTAFEHPAGWHTKRDIERIRAQIKSGREPWVTAYKALMDENSVGTGGATLDYQPSPGRVVCRDCGPAPPGKPPWDAHNETGNNEFQEDARAAYYLMVKWIATDNLSYATAAENVIDAWSAQLTGT